MQPNTEERFTALQMKVSLIQLFSPPFGDLIISSSGSVTASTSASDDAAFGCKDNAHATPQLFPIWTHANSC